MRPPAFRPFLPVLLAAAFAPVLAPAHAPALHAQENALCPERFHVEVEGERLSLPYCANRPIDQADPNVRRVVFSLHGVATNAGDYFRNMMAAAELVPGALDETLVIGPKLMTRAFANDHDLSPTDVFWNTSSDRFWGGESGSSERHPRTVTISAFEIYDRMLTEIADPERFPNLEIIVLAGHSGGGQFMNRYAMASPFEDEVARPRGIHVRYVVAQPSTHTYLTGERVDAGDRTRQRFRTPPAEEVEGCDAWDVYGSGLQGLENWPYMARVGAERMRERYRERDVVYFHGMDDSDPEDSQLARGCAAMLQGAHRLERGITYYNYIHHLYGTGNHNHRIAFTARVGHDHARMWASDEGLLFLFDHPPVTPGR